LVMKSEYNNMHGERIKTGNLMLLLSSVQLLLLI